MKQMKLNSKRKSSGQVVVLLIIVLVLLGGAWWWLYSQKQASAKEGTAFAKEAVQRIAVQHD
jgi:high-affinity Fe2+/Pb2+ permease